MSTYDPSVLEPYWQKYWEENKTFAAPDKSGKEKFYCLVEFPYPSSDGLHVGHPRSYTALDILARKKRMQGYNVLYPIGFDAFGLPSENYAIKTGIHPAKTTEKNIKIFTRQLKSLGLSFDWARQITTTDPKYYKWTQWIFLKMHEAGLAYKAKIPINWCLACKTGLANEEVVAGKCERCGGQVAKREKEQWMLKITQYADRLIGDLAEVDYQERIRIQQVNWIGRSEGATIKFQITNSKFQTNSKSQIPNSKPELEVYTTRPDTLFGATFMVIAPEHELIENYKPRIANFNEVEAYAEKAKRKSDLERTDLAKEKTGVEIKGLKAINPANHQEIPIFAADYVLAGYGTAAIMAVPAHDARDWEFAKKFNLPITEVISGGDVKKEAYTEIKNGQLVNSGQFDNLSVSEAIGAITQWLEERNLGKKAVNYKLRDWVFSRQRYWGEPIPMVYCQNCKDSGDSETGWAPVPEIDLPVKLPDVEKYEPAGTGESPLSAMTKWVNTKCPVCGGKALRETDTMPNWAGSNWYFLRYIDPKNGKALADKRKLEYWAPVDWYNGGMEHTTLHLLYSRFIYKFLWDIGAVPKSCGSEPYKKRTSHGMILGAGGEKMSKSRGNVVNPDEVVKQFGADTLRVYEMFMGPFDQAIPWDTKGVVGARRFLEKVWSIYNGAVKIVDLPNRELTGLVHKTIKKIGQDIETQDYNTAVSALMILTNKILELSEADKESLAALAKIISPFAPHLGEELWQKLGNKKTIAYEPWPEFDENFIKAENFEMIIQVNGKLRDKILAPSDTDEPAAEILARQSPKVNVLLAGKAVKNVIFVPGRLINFVV
ncbi:MAG: leucine--tRNA ligase [Candidatus Buchananbacteria bacterium RIFCSPHIGHO2_01_FULL_46_12]|uniref:Leucine--tRNA ligase n=2 Tax=Candidatus Buchananiibacteriota TaxID=1817903 RepID=A0A1G1Y658_9BACT|nr:MAG: leucine--tRNA ligase [Candidatus Buchananbacteria bacterium RIFCSPHIGHO2_01_FULL_46_12]OGY54447.1 MAG: leucine--tRNA ligase [Candidatus Buchananbacteria bacterium RIFCSPLOWO2_01_FULL_45_31]